MVKDDGKKNTSYLKTTFKEKLSTKCIIIHKAQTKSPLVSISSMSASVSKSSKSILPPKNWSPTFGPSPAFIAS
uniref:Uncharacterized protein n=1 Tax=Medicago truncatula TaxID=3880 RepID=I3SND9_MEDTR|nr:unknown [Medicago truncatula]